jgi:hypothetical protein
MEEQKTENTPEEKIKVFIINNEQVMFDYDVAEFFEVTIEKLKEVTAQNPDRFPDDFIYQPSQREFEHLKEDFPNSNLALHQSTPNGYTEGGLAMLSGLLNTGPAIDYSVAVTRLFAELNKASQQDIELNQRVLSLEKRFDEQLIAMNEALSNIKTDPSINRSPIGYKSKKG